MLSVRTLQDHKYKIIISIIILLIAYYLYKKQQDEKLGNTIGDRRPTSYGFNWWN